MNLGELSHRAAAVVTAIQQQLPLEIRALAVGVPVYYQPQPDAGILAEGFEADILGLFTGNPIGTEISHADPAPPRILLYMDSLWAQADGDLAEFEEEVRLTYLHELGHYLGWEEDDLATRVLD